MSLRQDEETIQAILDGRIRPAAFQAFEERLRREPELRRLYQSYARLDHTLLEKFEHAGDSTDKLVAMPRRRWMVPLAAAAAVVLAATLATVSLKSGPRATVEFGPESRGQVIQPKGSEDGFLSEGAIVRIDHGSAAVTLPSGTRALIEGPGSLEYRSRHWLHLGGGRTWVETAADHHDLTCTTDAFRVVGPGGEFGIITDPGRREELHVLRGTLDFELRDGGVAGAGPRSLDAGHAAIWSKSRLSTVPSPTTFASFFPRQVTVFNEDFDESGRTLLGGKAPDHGAGPWQVDRGQPAIEHGLLDTSGPERTTAFAPLSGPPLDDSNHVILLTIETDHPETSRFHSDGWAGVSLYAGDQERIFVGDPNGPARGWALHPVGSEARHACPLLEGKNIVTLRYDYRSGLAELYEGDTTTGPSLASEWIDPGLTFDRIRIANGSQLDAAIDAGMDPSVVGDSPESRERGDIALRQVRVRVLSTADSTRPPRP